MIKSYVAHSWRIRMCIHMYLYVFTCIHMYSYVFICIHMYSYVFVFTHDVFARDNSDSVEFGEKMTALKSVDWNSLRKWLQVRERKWVMSHVGYALVFFCSASTDCSVLTFSFMTRLRHMWLIHDSFVCDITHSVEFVRVNGCIVMLYSELTDCSELTLLTWHKSVTCDSFMTHSNLA